MDDELDKQRLTPASNLLGDGLAAIGGDLGRIVGTWPAIVGDRLAKVSTPSRLKAGVLHVRCSSASWAQALLGMELQLLERIAGQVGEGVVVRLNARAGGPAPRVEADAPPAPLRPPTAAEEREVDAMLRAIQDPELRARMRAAALASARRRNSTDRR